MFYQLMTCLLCDVIGKISDWYSKDQVRAIKYNMFNIIDPVSHILDHVYLLKVISKYKSPVSMKVWSACKAVDKNIFGNIL